MGNRTPCNHALSEKDVILGVVHGWIYRPNVLDVLGHRVTGVTRFSTCIEFQQKHYSVYPKTQFFNAIQ